MAEKSSVLGYLSDLMEVIGHRYRKIREDIGFSFRECLRALLSIEYDCPDLSLLVCDGDTEYGTCWYAECDERFFAKVCLCLEVVTGCFLLCLNAVS